jgi:hypothetical protein
MLPTNNNNWAHYVKNETHLNQNISHHGFTINMTIILDVVECTRKFLNTSRKLHLFLISGKRPSTLLGPRVNVHLTMETLSCPNVSEETHDDSIQNILVMTKEENFEEAMIQNFGQLNQSLLHKDLKNL